MYGYNIIRYTLTHLIPAQIQLCYHITKRIKDYRIRTVTFGIIQCGILIGKYRQRRYSCTHCGHAFSEHNTFVRKYMQMSITNLVLLLNKLNESLTYTAIAHTCDVSITTVLRYCAMIHIPKPNTLPPVIGVDELKAMQKDHNTK